MEVKNSSGYFKDPVTFKDFSVDTPRMVKCALSAENKFTWPMVATSNGDLVKIVYKFFTDEEKLLYKKYRGYDTSKPLRTRSSKPKPSAVTMTRQGDEQDSIQTYEVEDMSYTAICIGSERLIAECDKYIGSQFCSGITYALLKKANNNVIYWIPRALISEQEIIRLSN